MTNSLQEVNKRNEYNSAKRQLPADFNEGNKYMKIQSGTKSRPVAKFLMKLFHMLSEGDEETRRIVSWLPEDDACFYISDLSAFANDVLPKYFASTLESFKRFVNFS